MFFSKQKEQSKNDVEEPFPGEVWYMDDGSPWPTKFNVKIIDVKSGWVRYSIGTVWPDERKEISTFVRIYKKQA